MSQETVPPRKRSNSYNIFIFVLTLLSLAIMVVMLLPLAPQTLDLLRVYDNLICVIFLIDFAYSLLSTPKKSDYFIKERGWLDLLGSIPALGITQYGGLLRLARLSRLARIARLMKGENKKELVADVLQNRSQYAAFITILLTILVLTISSVLVLQFESKDPAASIQTGADALWYSIVTITTVGYGDFYPVTGPGRIAGMFIMFAGVGIIGALASLLSSLLVGGGSSAPAEEAVPAAAGPSDPEVVALKKELAEMHRLLEKIASDMPVKS
jgi:voltage-gated potassium channel